MKTGILKQIHSLQQMTVAELRQEWERLYDEPTRSRNRDYLWRRLAWRIQELQRGGLSGRAKARINELAPDGFRRARTPSMPNPEPTTSPSPKRTPVRDIRLPTPGTVLSRKYHGREIRVVTLDDGFEWDGRVYRSLSAVAKAVTGQKWNGRLFFGLTRRKRK